jgi:hypothetical protein
LTDAQLKQLIGRAQGGLRHLDLSNIASSLVTDRGLAAALCCESLHSFAANGGPLTGAGIAAALTCGSRGRLRELKVCGVCAVAPAFASCRREHHVRRLSCMCTLNALSGLLAPTGTLDAAAPCGMTSTSKAGGMCARMVASGKPCSECHKGTL